MGTSELDSLSIPQLQAKWAAHWKSAHDAMLREQRAEQANHMDRARECIAVIKERYANSPLP